MSLHQIIAPTLKPLRRGESINEAVINGNFLQNLPNFVRNIMAWMLRKYSSPAGRNDDWATLLEGFAKCPSIQEERELFVKKDAYLAEWNTSLNESKLDFVLGLPFPTPAIPKNTTGKATLISAAGCFLYNFVRPLVYFCKTSLPNLFFPSSFFSLTILPGACQSRS